MRHKENVVVSEDKLVFQEKLSGHEFIFRKYFKPLTVYAMKMTGNREDAEDIVQDVFIQLWKKDSIPQGDDITPYLFVAVKNGCLKRVRHLKVVQKYENSLSGFGYIDDNPHHYMMLREVETCIEETLSAMPERTRDIFMLSRFEQKKHKEIAESLEISIKTVEAHLTKVLAALRKRLSHHLGSLMILMNLIDL